jgi:hypothetical protein
MGLGSGIRKKPIPDPGSLIPDPGVKKAPDPGSGSATLVVLGKVKLSQPFALSGICEKNSPIP